MVCSDYCREEGRRLSHFFSYAHRSIARQRVDAKKRSRIPEEFSMHSLGSRPDCEEVLR